MILLGKGGGLDVIVDPMYSYCNCFGWKPKLPNFIPLHPFDNARLLTTLCTPIILLCTYQYTQHITQADEEPVDILPQLRQDCIKSCPVPKAAYEACIKRIEKKGEGDCEAWYFDMLTCVDKCVAPKIFKHVK